MEEVKKFLKSGTVADKLGVTSATLINWHKEGILIPERVLQSGHRLYSVEQITNFIENQLKS